MQHSIQAGPIQTGHVILMLVGILLVFSGPYITYRTVLGMKRARQADPNASMHWVSNGLNFVIAFLFSAAGVLFIINNLRGNPLS